MKTIGLIGGMSWESTITYYQVINSAVKDALGGLHSAKCLLYSVDFQEIASDQSAGDWGKSADTLCGIATTLERAGADFIVICTNTMHKVAPQIEKAVSIPLLHIADVTAQALKTAGIETAALLGTKYTMEQDFYKSRLIENGITVLVPDEDDRVLINDIIFNELCLGVQSDRSKSALLSIVNQLAGSGAQGVILGCTELGLALRQTDTSVPLFDTALIHAQAAAFCAMNVS